MYRHVDAALVRASAWHPDRPTVWPDLTGAFADPTSWQAWLQQSWTDTDFAGAVRAASPDLATRVEQICAGQPIPAPAVRRTVVAVLRYLLRARTRATPFRLFAGIAAVRIGTLPALRVGTDHRATAIADAAHSTALIDYFEQHPALRPRLMLLASSLLVERDGYMVIEHRPSGTLDRRPDHVQVRLTAPVREALGGAQTPVLWNDLAERLSTSFPSAPPSVIDRLIADLVSQRVLLTSLRPPMTVTDPLTALVEQAAHLPPTEAAEIRSTPRSARDLRVDWDLTLPTAVVQEAAAAAKALIRLAPQASLTGWAEWHRRFLDRYGPRAAVPVLGAIDVLGYPPGYLGATTAPTASPLPDRVGRLIKLAHTAGMQRRLEIQLDDAAIEDLSTVDPGRPVQPSTELTVRIDAESVAALHQEEFTLHVVGVARSAGATTGRFLHLLDDEDRRRMTETYGALPPVHQGALSAQISSPSVGANRERRPRPAGDRVGDLARRLPQPGHPPRSRHRPRSHRRRRTAAPRLAVPPPSRPHAAAQRRGPGPPLPPAVPVPDGGARCIGRPLHRIQVGDGRVQPAVPARVALRPDDPVPGPLAPDARRPASRIRTMAAVGRDPDPMAPRGPPA